MTAPGCTVCGYIVEWVRSAYTSKWRLFRGRPDIETPGRYVFAPPRTPHFPFYHNLGSRDWTSDERDPWPDLGEVEGDVRRWASGAAELPRPLPLLIGTADCLTNGDTWPRVPADVSIEGGWDSRCPQLPPPPLDTADCHWQQWAADVLIAMYTEDEAAVIAAAKVFYPFADVSYTPAGNTVFPGSCIVQDDAITVVLVTGTANEIQWIVQFLNGAIGIVNTGQYRTLQLWEAASNVILNRMLDAAVSPTVPLALVGHSYGAATCGIVAFKVRQFTPNRALTLLTFGQPKPGDIRLINGLFGIQQTHYVAKYDPVTLLPVSGWEAAAVAFLLPGPTLRLTRDFRPFQNRTLLLDDGSFQEGYDEEAFLLALVWFILLCLTPFPPPINIYVHSMQNYRRLLVCAPFPPGPPEFEFIASGGLAGDGSAAMTTTILPATGGLAGDGSAGSLWATGGLAGDGSAGLVVGFIIDVAGGLAGDGSAGLVVGFIIDVAGGLAGDGSAEVLFPYVVAGGGLAGDGSASLLFPYLVAAGGLAGDGSAMMIAAISVILEEDYSPILEENYQFILTELP